jgi:hypothetical protein
MTTKTFFTVKTFQLTAPKSLPDLGAVTSRAGTGKPPARAEGGSRVRAAGGMPQTPAAQLL